MEEEKYTKSFLIKVSVVVMLFTLIVSIVVSMLFYYSYFSSKYSEYTDLLKIKTIVDQNYLNEADGQEMIDYAMKGYVAGLGDKYAAYYPEKEYKLLVDSMNSQYVGIGVMVSENKDGNLLVSDVVDNSPASNAGVLPGDVISYVNNYSVSGLGSNKILSMIKSGKEGDKISLTVVRNGEKLHLNLKLSELHNYTINYALLNSSIAYIKITSFNTDTHKYFKEALEMAQKDNASKLIIDLRNNPGGEADATEKIADELLDESVIYYSVDKNGKKEYVRAKDGSVDMPIAVLVNGNTASASELLSGALKDNGRAVIIGEKTYGKGVIQGLYNIKKNAAVKLTIAEYFTPKNKKVNGVGITPDIEVKLSEGAVIGDYETDNQLTTAINYLNGGQSE